MFLDWSCRPIVHGIEPKLSWSTGHCDFLLILRGKIMSSFQYYTVQGKVVYA